MPGFVRGKKTNAELIERIRIDSRKRAPSTPNDNQRDPVTKRLQI